MKETLLTIIAIMLMAGSSAAQGNPGREGVAASKGETVTFPCLEVSMQKDLISPELMTDLVGYETACQSLESDNGIADAVSAAIIADAIMNPPKLGEVLVAIVFIVTEESLGLVNVSLYLDSLNTEQVNTEDLNQTPESASSRGAASSQNLSPSVESEGVVGC